MPATLTSTRIGAHTDRAVLNQFQQDPARLWTKNQLAIATNMSYTRVHHSVDSLLARALLIMVRNTVHRGGILGNRAASYMLADL